MDTGVVITQEPVFTKTSIEEAHAGVVLEHSTMDVDKVNLSTILDDSRTSAIEEKPEVAEVLNGPGNKETEESKHEKEEVVKTISVVEDSKMVKEKERETETDDDAKVILTDVTLEKEKEDETTQKPEEVSVETETINSQEQEKDISKAIEEIPIKTDEVEEEKDSRTVETSVNGTEAEHNETVSVKEITRNGENIVKETAPEQETTTHVVETTERILVEAEKDETETLNTVVKDPEVVSNEETTVHDLKENEEAVEAIKKSDDAEQVSREVTGDKEKEEDIIHKEAEVQESPTVIETPTIQGEDTEPKASKETEEHEHVLVRDIPQDETLVPKAETVDTSTVQESEVLKTMETKSDETDIEPSLDLKEKEETVTPSDEVLVELPKPSPDQRSIDTEENEHVLGSKMPQQGEAESLVTKEDKEQEKTENFEVPIDLALKVDREELMDEKKEADQVAGAKSIERGLALNESEGEETPVIKHPDVESGEQMEKPSLESPSKLSEETRKTLEEKIQEKAEEEEEEVSPHQEGQEEGSYGSEKVPVPESIESCLPVEKDEEVKSDDVIQVSSASPEGEKLVEAKKIEVIKANEEEEQLAVDKTQSILETESVKSNEETTVHESIVSHEVTGDREKEEDIIIHKAQEVPESLTVVETPTIQGEDIELKDSEDTEEHEHVLVRDIPQEETLVPKSETVNTSTVHVSGEPSLDLKEQEETVKTVTSSDEVQQSITLMEPPKLSPEQISKDTKEDEHVLERSMPQGEIFVTEAESLVTKESKETVMDLKEQEKTEKLEEVPSDLALEVDKEEVMEEKKEAVDDVAGDQNMERGLELNESEAELVEKQSIESPSEETSKTLDEKIKEEVSSHQEVQEEGSCELKEKSQEERSLDLTPLQEESCLPLEQNEEEIKEQIHKHEQENEEVKSDEVTQISSGSPEGETVVEAKKKEEIKANEEEQVVKTETVNTVVKNPEIVSNEETTVHDLKENEAAVEAIKNSDDAEQVSREVTGDKVKEEDIIHKEAEVQESPTVIETPTIQGEDTEPKASKETEEHEHVLVREIPQDETLVPKAETVDTSAVQESAILKTLETESDETDTEPSLDLKKEEETVTPSDEVLVEPPKPSPDQRFIDTKEDENVLGSKMPQGEAESLVTEEDKGREKTENFEVPIDLALKVDREELMDEKKEADQVAGAQSMERGLALNESEAEETPVIQHESGEQMEKPSLESPSKLSEETIKTLEEKIQEKAQEEEEVSPHQEGQEEGSYGSEKVPVPESIESCLPVEKDEEVKSDDVIQVSSASPEGETLVEAKKIEVIKSNEEEEQLAADKTQSILDTEPVKSNEETTVHESIVSHEETGDREKEEDIIIHKAQEVQESITVVETRTIQDEDIELKASKDNEGHEHVLVRDIPQEETLVPKAETVNTSTLHVSGEPSLDLKEQEETVKTVTSSDEVQQSITLMEPPKLSPEQISKDTQEDEHVLERSMPQGEIFVTEAESLVTKENKEAVMDLKEEEKTEKLEEVPSDLALEVDKEEVMEEKKEAADDFAGDQNMERDLELNESEAELVDQNITDEAEEELVEKQSIESPSEETSKTLDEKIQEEVSPHQEVQEEGSYELKEKAQEERSLDLTPLQDESCLPLEKNEEEIKEQIHKHEQENEEVKCEEVTQVSSGSPEGETVVEAKKKEEIKASVLILETVETVDTEPVKSNEDDIAESLNLAGEEIQTESKDEENVQKYETAETSVNGTEDEHIATVLEEGISKNNESIVPEAASEEIKKSDEAEENSHKVTGDREKEEDIMTWKTTEEMHEENTTMEHESLFVRDVPQIDTLVTEAEDVNTSTVHKFESNEAEVGQETKKDTEPSFDLKEDQEKEETETVISSDEVRPSDQVDDVETEEYVEVKPKETLQGESTEENLLDVPSADSEKLQPETVLVAKTESQDTVEDIPSDLVLKEEVKDDKTEVDGTQVMGETRDLEPNEPEAEQTDQTKTDKKLLVESVEKMQTSSLEFPYELSEEKTTTVDEKMEEVTLQQEKSDQVIKVSSVSPSEEQEGEIIVDAVKLEDKTEEEKIKNSLEPLEPKSLMPSYSEEQEHKTISEKTEDEKVKEEEPSVQILSEEDETKSHVTEAETEVRDTQQGETIDEPESVDNSTVQEAAVLNTLETKINESEAVHSAIVGEEEEEERQVTRKDIEPSFEMTEDQEKETIISSDEVAKILDEPTEKMPSLESPSEETSKTADEKMEEEVTLHQESEGTVTVPESSELGVQAKEEEEESCPPKNETKEKMSEEGSTSAVEEKSDQVSSAPLSEEPEAEKMEALKENEEEQVAEAVEPHSSFPSPPEESDTVAEKVKEAELMGDTGTGSSSKLVEEEKLKQDKEILEVPSSETIPQETLSDDVSATITETHEEEAQTRDIEPFVTDKHQEEEQANEESPRKKVISAEVGETQTREPEEENMVDSSEKNDNETLIAETKKEDEDETVGLDDASKTSENECSKQEEFENLETPKVEEDMSQEVSETMEEIETTGGDQSPSFITELEDQIPKQIKEIHEEEIKEALAVVDQTSSLVSEQVEEIHEEEEETKESHKVEDLGGQNLPVEASQTLSDDRTAKQVEEETKAHKLQEEEETKPKESDDQIETSTDVTKVEDEEEDTKETDTQVAEIMKAQELKGTLQPGAAMEDQDPENSSDDFTFSKSIGDKNSSTLPVVGILKELQTTLEENERGNDLKSINAEPETLEKSLVLEETPASQIIEANMLQDSISREVEFNVEETLQEENPADLSLTQVLPGEKILIPSNQEEGKKQEDLNASTSEKISLQEEEHPGDFEISNKEHNAEAQETIKEEDQTFDIKEEKKNEELQDEKLGTLYATRETDETSSPEVNNNNNQEDASELGVGHDSATTPQVEEEQEAHSVLENDQEVLLTSEKKITEPLSVAEKELTEQHVQAQAVSDDTKSSSEMDVNSEQIPKDQIEEAEETADSLITSENVQLQDLSKGFGQEKQQSTDLTYVQEDLDDDIKDDGHDSVLAHKKDSDLIEEKKEVDYVKTEQEDAIKHGVSTPEKKMCEKTGLEATKEIYQEECKQTDTATGVKEEIKEEEKETTEDSLNSMKNADDETKDYGLDSVVAQKKESGSIEEKKEVDYVKTELEDAVKHGVCTEENNNMSGKIGQEATKEIYEEECKQTNTVTAIKEEMKEEKKDTPEDFLNSMKNTDDATEKSKPEIQEIDKLSPASETPPKQGDEVPTQQKREIADDVPKIENLEIAEKVQQKYGEDETEPTVKEPARKSLSDLIQNVKVTDKTEVATTEPHIEEEAKAEGEDEDGDEHKDDKTSPDSIVMVEAKETVSIIKTQKKSHGILSGVGSKVKHSISKVKKALTGKSSHPTKPSSPQ